MSATIIQFPTRQKPVACNLDEFDPSDPEFTVYCCARNDLAIARGEQLDLYVDIVADWANLLARGTARAGLETVCAELDRLRRLKKQSRGR